MAWVYIVRGLIATTSAPLKNLERRIAEHRRGSNHTTRRFDGELILVATKQLWSMSEAGALETQLKRKKNPHLAILALKSKDNLTE